MFQPRFMRIWIPIWIKFKPNNSLLVRHLLISWATHCFTWYVKAQTSQVGSVSNLYTTPVLTEPIALSQLLVESVLIPMRVDLRLVALGLFQDLHSFPKKCEYYIVISFYVKIYIFLLWHIQMYVILLPTIKKQCKLMTWQLC